jgi:phenylalanyl-tRNA synthetase beta chain
MKISRNWLQTYFDTPLPDATTISDALTFHVFEIDGTERIGSDDVLDVKVTANRGHDCLSHRGIAKELSAILNIQLKSDPLRTPLELPLVTDAVTVSIESTLCNRYIAGLICGVKVGPSPQWLRERLEAIGQRSINNIVDATNYVMFDLGQPLHAFDAGKLACLPAGTASSSQLPASSEKEYEIHVRAAQAGEKMTALDGKEYTLNESNLIIADGSGPIGIAGVKGGMASGIDESTTDIIIESAHFDSVSVRKTAQTLKLRTDASARFEQNISPELAMYGMQAVITLIQQIAGGELLGVNDLYPKTHDLKPVSVSLTQINAVLGTDLSQTTVSDTFNRLTFPYTVENDVFMVTPPFERLDILIPEDLIEEVGRIVGYDTIAPVELPPLAQSPTVNANFAAAERMREELVAQGYSEVFTSVFAERGERLIANKIDGVRPYLRANLIDGLTEAVKRNIPNKDLLGLKEIKLFEIGTIWHKGSEEIVVAIAGEKEKALQKSLVLESGKTSCETLPLSETIRYQSFSRYPYIVRDIALWVPVDTTEELVLEIIQKDAGDLLVKVSLFDRFEKADKLSLAFRLIFQSFDRTLVDAEVNTSMQQITEKVTASGWQVR